MSALEMWLYACVELLFFIYYYHFCLSLLSSPPQGSFFFKLSVAKNNFIFSIYIVRSIIMGHAEVISPGHVYVFQVEEDRT